MEKHIISIIKESMQLHENIYKLIPVIKTAADIMTDCIKKGGKIMFAGNGGSAGDAQHLAAEFVNRFKKERKPLAGLALTTDTSTITAIGNDYSFEEIFSKQVEALGKKGDVFFGISTSGTSKNIIRAIEAANSMGITTIGLAGEGGLMSNLVDCSIAVPSNATPRIQEMHILIGHILSEIVEEKTGQRV